MLIRSCRNSVNPWKAPLDQFDRAWSSFFPEPLRGWSRFSWPLVMGTPDKDHGDPARRTDSAANKNVSHHLSNERTYLAFIRTAIALITFGVTTNRFSVFLLQSNLVSRNETIRWNLVDVEKAGLGMVIFGMIMVIWAAFEYMRVQRLIDRGDYRPDSRIIWTIAIVIVGGGGFGLLWLFHR